MQLLRAISETYNKGADIGECLSTAYRIKAGDFESWYIEWLKTAKRVYKYADECLASGHDISALEASLRASNYYRVAEFLLIDPENPRIQTTWGMSKQCFAEVAKLFSPRFEPVQIPYEETSLPGYLYRVDEKKYTNRSRPILIVHGGLDSTRRTIHVSSPGIR